LVAECEAVGVPWFSSVFGLDSLALLDSLNCPAYKVAALDVNSYLPAMLELADDKPIIASSRGEFVPWADLTLYCPPGYPQEWQTLSPRAYDVSVSYHGTDATFVKGLVSAGAPMIEVHVQLDDVPSELEANVSLTVSQLRDLMYGVVICLQCWHDAT
jgi:sialic acid synthase SpsE